MADIADEFEQYAKQRGYTFSPASRAALPRDFPKLQGLENLSDAERAALFGMVLDEVSQTRGSPPLDLHENDIPDAGRRLSQRFVAGNMPFNVAAQGIIRDCCPFC